MKDKKLLILFVALLVIYALTKVLDVKKDRSFDTDLVKIDTASVTRIVVYPKADDFAEVTLTRENNGWIVTKGGVSTKAMPDRIQSVLGQLALIKTKRIVAKKPEKHAEYEVEQGKGTRIQVWAGDKLLRDFIIGRFNFNQQTRQATSFVRLTDQDEIFAVDGFLSMSLGQGFDSYRNKKLARLTPADVTGFDVQLRDVSFQIGKTPEGWKMNESTPVDSTEVQAWLSTLAGLNGSAFADDFDPARADDLRTDVVTVHANNQSEPLRLECFTDSTRTPPFIIHSNLNPDNWFESDSTGVYKKIFDDLRGFLSDIE
ncbi:MAG: DUF4340 domain-containing protein [Bacteroidetes bacterium]|nr:MAG: DUF4340 domain-containing protein [Bacteroidota bacterium]